MGSKKNALKRKRAEGERDTDLSALEESPDEPCARWCLRGPEALGFRVEELQPLCIGLYSLGLTTLADPNTMTMRGEGVQKNLNSDTCSYYDATEAYMRYGLECAIGEERARELPLQGMSIHVMRPGDGPQPTHADLSLGCPEDDAHAAECYSVLLYTCDGPSTQLPTLTAAQHDLAIKCRQAQRELLTKKYFWMMEQVSMGSLLVMRGDVFHSAPRNTLLRPRVCVYGLFSPVSLVQNPRQMSQVTWPHTPSASRAIEL